MEQIFFTFSLQICLHLPYILILKYILDRLRPTQSKNSSYSLNLFRSSPCFPTMFIILFSPFKRFSYFFTKDIRSLTSFVIFASSFRFKSCSLKTSNIDACNSFDHFRCLFLVRFSHDTMQT